MNLVSLVPKGSTFNRTDLASECGGRGQGLYLCYLKSQESHVSAQKSKVRMVFSSMTPTSQTRYKRVSTTDLESEIQPPKKFYSARLCVPLILVTILCAGGFLLVERAWTDKNNLGSQRLCTQCSS